MIDGLISVALVDKKKMKISGRGKRRKNKLPHVALLVSSPAGADPGFFLGGGALISCSTSTPINHILFFFWQNTSCI